MLNENGELLLKDKDVADTFNEYFRSFVESLDLYKWESEISDLGLNDSNQDYLDITIRKYEKHSQPAFTCSKLTIETLEQGVKYVQS